MLASFEVSPATGYTAETALALQRAVLDRVEVLPGVESATIAEWVPMTFSTQTSDVEPDGYVPREHESRDVRRAYVGPGYARTMRIRLAAGRDFTKLDGAGQEPVAIVNQAFADRYWRGLEPLGRRVRADGRWHSVVGVTANTAYLSVGEAKHPVVYLPLLSRWRFGTILHALALATLGIYGVIAYSTRQRTQEIAIRMAMGADASAVVHLVMSRGVRLTLIGLALGLAASVGVTRLLRTHLYGVTALDPVTFGSVVLLLAAVSLAASYLPARRATRVEPSAALRQS